ncbi:MAG: zinc-ribbon domain-containing protein [Bacteroidales bacterium]|jgi:hypothetical protein
MKYCKECGRQIEENALFCYNCGEKNTSAIKEHTSLDEWFLLAMAYLGTLFWIPLVFRKQSEQARYCANQGLWILILATSACLVINLLGVIRDITSAVAGGLIFNSLYGLIFMAFLAFMAFLSINAFSQMFRLYRNEQLRPIWFFDEHRIIN